MPNPGQRFIKKKARPNRTGFQSMTYVLDTVLSFVVKSAFLKRFDDGAFLSGGVFVNGTRPE
jgi:hypothetical protein